MSKVKRDGQQRLQLTSIQAVKFNHATCKKADTSASWKVYQNVVLSCVFLLDREKFQENWCPSFFPWILGISSSSHKSWSFQEAWTLWGYPASVGLPDQAPVFVDLPPGAEKFHHPTLSGFPVLSSGSLCCIETFDSIQNWSPAELVYVTTHLRLAFATFDFCSAHPKNLRNHQLKLQACCRSTLQSLYISVYCEIYIYICICTLSPKTRGIPRVWVLEFSRFSQITPANMYNMYMIIYMHIYVATKEIKREFDDEVISNFSNIKGARTDRRLLTSWQAQQVQLNGVKNNGIHPQCQQRKDCDYGFVLASDCLWQAITRIQEYSIMHNM